MSSPPPRLKRLNRPQLADRAAQHISEWISSLRLRPGARLPSEQELMEALGLGRSVVREALAKLKAVGIVETFQGRGAFVANVPFELLRDRIRRWPHGAVETGRELEYIWELREIFEVAIAELAAERRTEQDLEQLQQCWDHMNAAIGAGRQGVEEDAMFHYCLARATQNPVLLQLIEDVSQLIEAARRDSLNRTGRPAASNREHGEILAAVRDADIAHAGVAMRQHLGNGRRIASAHTNPILDDRENTEEKPIGTGNNPP